MPVIHHNNIIAVNNYYLNNFTNILCTPIRFSTRHLYRWKAQTQLSYAFSMKGSKFRLTKSNFINFKICAFILTAIVLFILCPLWRGRLLYHINGVGLENYLGSSIMGDQNQPSPILLAYLASIENVTKYLVDTPACKIPVIKLMPNHYKRNWSHVKNPDCDYEVTFTKVVENEKENETTLHLSTSYLSSIIMETPCNFTWLKPSGEVGGSENFTKYIKLPPTAVSYVVRCDKSINAGLRLPLTPDIGRKIKFWQDKQKSLPINVLFLGFDTLSRSHAYRSLPKTTKLMLDMGFYDFRGFHSVSLWTVENLKAFLIGSFSDKNEETPSDNCPKEAYPNINKCQLIWDKLGESPHNFITSYMDDSPQQTYRALPHNSSENLADYSVSAIFDLARQERLNYQGQSVDPNCMTSDSIPTVMCRQVRQFLSKFSKAPFFAFNFFATPFHDDGMALKNFDDEISQIFHQLKEDPHLLERTLVILTGDHGDRHPLFRTDSTEALFERTLPPLFVHFPESMMEGLSLEEKNKILSALHTNSHGRLSSSFDVYQTILHAMNLSGINLKPNLSFPPPPPHNRVNGTSLLVEIPGNRTCQDAGVVQGICVCNSWEGSGTVHDDDLIRKLIIEGVNWINDQVQDYNSTLCSPWFLTAESKVHAIETWRDFVENFSDITLKFKAFIRSTYGGTFSAKFRVYWIGSRVFGSDQQPEGVQENYVGIKKMQMIQGSVQRISNYGSTSSCVTIKSPKDKMMQGLCHCVGSLGSKAINS